MTVEGEILRANFSACAQRIEKLNFSIRKNQPIFPLSTASVETLSDEQEESIDALILRYSQCVSMIQDQLFRGIAYLEQEDLTDKSNRDKTLLMEKLGAIKSADEFGTAAILRNKFSHHYPELVAARIERLNLALKEAEYVIDAFADVRNYLIRKGFIERTD
jgi:hypothetical protein